MMKLFGIDVSLRGEDRPVRTEKPAVKPVRKVKAVERFSTDRDIKREEPVFQVARPKVRGVASEPREDIGTVGRGVEAPDFEKGGG